MTLLFVLFFLLVPVAIVWLVMHQRWAEKVGAIVLCYLAGLLLGNSGLIPAEALEVQQSIAAISIVLALPMLLFTLDVKQWSRVAGKAMLSMVFATTSVMVLASSFFFVFEGQGVETSSHLAAMSVGVYTGGTPNLAAIKAGLGIPHSEYIVFHSLDTLLGASYMMAMLTIGIPLFRFILPKPLSLGSLPEAPEKHFNDDDFAPLVRRENLPQVLKTLALGLVVLGVATLLAEVAKVVFALESSSAVVIVLLTTIGILCSFNHRVRKFEFSYKMGMSLIYVFCFVVASMARLDELKGVNPGVAVFLFGTMAGSIFLHALLCRLARIDSDTFMATSVAAVCSPPFVPMVAKALGNSGVLLSGMTTGIIGYALGNYLGISLALFLQSL